MKKNSTVVIGSVISFCYVIGVYYLYSLNKLSLSDILNNLTAFVGWILALIIGFIHLSKTRGDTVLAHKEETRKSLQIDAFREINAAMTVFSRGLGEIYNAYLVLPGKLDLHIKNPQFFKFDRNEILQTLREVSLKIHGGAADFYLAIESNEMAVLDYDHYRKYIHFVVEDSDKLSQAFIFKWSLVNQEAFSDVKTREEFAHDCHEVSEKVMDLQCYLHDYRIELINGLLSDVFEKNVPERVPLDKRYKTLKDLAIKSKVQAEFKARSDRAFAAMS